MSVMLRMCTFYIKDFGCLVRCHKTILVETPHMLSTATSDMGLPIPIRHGHSFGNVFMQGISCVESSFLQKCVRNFGISAATPLGPIQQRALCSHGVSVGAKCSLRGNSSHVAQTNCSQIGKSYGRRLQTAPHGEQSAPCFE
jgi:hypothetical protein